MSVIQKEKYDLNIIKWVIPLSLLIAFIAVIYVLFIKEKNTSLVVEPLTKPVEISKTKKPESTAQISTPEKPAENENCTVPQSKLCKNEINEIAICKKDIGEVQKSLHHCATAEFRQATELKRSRNDLKTAQKDLNETKKTLSEKEAEYIKKISSFNTYSQLNERLYFGLEHIKLERNKKTRCPAIIPFKEIRNLCKHSEICFDHKSEINATEKGVIYLTHIKKNTDKSKFYQYGGNAIPKVDNRNVYSFDYETKRDTSGNLMLEFEFDSTYATQKKPSCLNKNLFHISIFTENSERKIAHGTIQYIYNDS